MTPPVGADGSDSGISRTRRRGVLEVVAAIGAVATRSASVGNSATRSFASKGPSPPGPASSRDRAEPVVEAGRAEPSAVTRHEGALAQPGAEVPSMRIGDHDALIAPRRATLAGRSPRTATVRARRSRSCRSAEQRARPRTPRRRHRRRPSAGSAPEEPAPCRRRVASSAMRLANSKNCVAWTIEYGIDEFSMSFSCATFARM